MPSDEKGVTCTCGKFTPYDGYVFAHWTTELTLTCECGRVWRGSNGIFEENAMEPIKIGQTIYVRCSEYSLFHEYQVVGETSRSWLVRKPKDVGITYLDDIKIPKKMGKGYIQGTKYDADLFAWAMEHRWKIGQAFDVCRDPLLILATARALKHELSLKELPSEVTQ
jgi:hypothetical protein